MIYIVQLSQEVCINKNGGGFDSWRDPCDQFGLELFGLICGFLIISTAEPMVFVS